MQKMPRAWLVFVVVEAVAVISWMAYPFFDSAVGPALWGLQVILLMPGSVPGELLVERTLWMSGVSLRTMAILSLAASLLINAGIWYVLLGIWRRAWSQRAL